MRFWESQPFDLQIPHGLGNCDFCFNKGKNKRVQILVEHPEVARQWAEWEALTNSTFDKSHSVLDIVQIAQEKRRNPQTSIDFGAFDFDIDCACNID